MSHTRPAKPWGRIVKVALALLLLGGLYAHADWRAVGQALRGLHAGYLTAAFLLFVPQTLLSAVRWRRLVAPVCTIGVGEAVRQTLAASAWNLVMPSKLGDFSKGAMLPVPMAARAKAAGLVVIEKVVDAGSLAAWWLVGYLAVTLTRDAAVALGAVAVLAAAAAMLHAAANANGPGRVLPGLGVVSIAAMSLVLWVLHLWQIDLFLKSAGVFVSWPVAASRIPTAIFAGLLPLSFCGVGTRDAVLVWSFADVAPASTMAAVGLLTATRYLVPGAVGIPLAGGSCSHAAVASGQIVEKSAGCAAFSAD